MKSLHLNFSQIILHQVNKLFKLNKSKINLFWWFTVTLIVFCDYFSDQFSSFGDIFFHGDRNESGLSVTQHDSLRLKGRR